MGALVAVSAAGCSSKVALVNAGQARMQPITRTVSANGKIELTQNFEAHAAAEGQVKEIYVKLGDKVHPGQLLLRMDDAEARLHLQSAALSIASAQNAVSNMSAGGTAEEVLNSRAEIGAAQANVQQLKARLATLQQLQSNGQAAANEVTAAQTQLTEAQNKVTALQAKQTGRYSAGDMALQREQVARSRAELVAAQSSLAGSDIHSPLAGTVYALPVNQYATVSAGEDLVNVADLTKIRVRAFFDEPEIGRLAAGQPVRIIWDAQPDRTWHGHILQAPTSITNYGTRNVGECLITVDDSTGDLIPNVNVTLYVTTLHRDSVLAIPRESLRTDGTNNYVFKIVEGKLRRTPVQVDVVSQTLVQITSGLQPGDSVVRVPLNDVDLRDGSPVKVQR